MKVLLLTPTTAGYNRSANGYNGGGWIDSIVTRLRQRDDVELAVGFMKDGEPFKVENDGIIYYPIKKYRKPLWQRIACWLGIGRCPIERKTWPFFQQHLKSVVNDFQPDVIEVFGSESPLGLVAEITNIPTILHIQGILNPYFNAFFPPGISPVKFYFEDFNPIHIKKRMDYVDYFRVNCMRELYIVDKVKHFIGRTLWDQRVMSALSPKADYHYGGEILRDVFYGKHKKILPTKPIFVSTISQPLYKGADVILKTAKILKNAYKLNFDWIVYGMYTSAAVEKREKINGGEVNVCFAGVATPEKLADSIVNCTVYVHPSYIDNSPNSLCEAQMLGCTCVAACVGGVSSLIENGKNGFLIPSNDPYQMAFLLNWLSNNPSINMEIGERAKEIAGYRHSKERIVEDLMNTFKGVVEND